ncbi:MAG: AmmeMemoRadiSam system protein B [Longimicrobiales bacterium]
MTTRPGVRPPAVAGRFYPDDPRELEAKVRGFLAAGARGDGSSPDPRGAAAPPVALVAPHAGYVYSGPVAGSAYRLVVPRRGNVRRVVILGPSHFAAFRGLALPECAAFDTPLGEHLLDPDGVAALEAHPLVQRSGRAHTQEHSLEVQLPFLRVALGPVPILPLVTGEAEPDGIADVLGAVWDAGTLVVVSSDLSHYLPYDRAQKADRRTADAVERLEGDALGPHDACGVVALRGLLDAARRRGLGARCVDLRNSGDTEGSRDRVVGYGAFAFWDAA